MSKVWIERNRKEIVNSIADVIVILRKLGFSKEEANGVARHALGRIVKGGEDHVRE